MSRLTPGLAVIAQKRGVADDAIKCSFQFSYVAVNTKLSRDTVILTWQARRVLEIVEGELILEHSEALVILENHKLGPDRILPGREQVLQLNEDARRRDHSDAGLICCTLE